MRISKIKIAGFKSFVDPTTLEFRGNLNGVVGPNGCGKSNIIDAIQWVMGESSAKHLRGDSMADVIFNGSGTRKPVGQASVELIFDNADGKIGGQYAGYGEISIKRQVGRDGFSTYYLNGVRCRRRDVTGIFLGTGIGARTYSVIEQGMISRVIEAKPEELRAFLEEAAGISKYKERRRETENRIRNTRENLARITDIVTELDKQLQHLQRQAKSAERYQTLKQEERTTQAQLLALRGRTLQIQLETQRREIEQRANAVEATTAAWRAAEAEIVRERESRIAATDRFNAVQGRFYSVGAEVARLEQQIQHAQERRQAMTREFEQTERGALEASEHIATDEKRLETLRQELADIHPRQARDREEQAQALAGVTEAEAQVNEWQGRWDAFNHRQAEAVRQQHIEQMRHEHLDDAIETARQRAETLRRERDGLVPDTLHATLQELARRVSDSQGAQQGLLSEHQQNRGTIESLREQTHRLSTQLDGLRQQRQQVLGRSASLEALHQSSLGTDRPALAQWLRETGLGDSPRLSDFIEVEAGWERAVEIAARLPLQALCINDIGDTLARLSSLREGSAAAYATAHAATAAHHANSDTGLPLLAARLRAPWPVADLFHGVHAADSVQAAHAAVPKLRDGESVITPDGTWLGPAWVMVNRDTDAAGGVLQRTQEMKSMAAAAARLEGEVDACAAALDAARAQLTELEQRDAVLRTQVTTAQESLATLRSQAAAGQARFEQTTQRLAQVVEELQDLESQLADDEAELRSTQARLEQAQGQRPDLEAERQSLAGERERLRTGAADARARWQAQRDAGHALAAQAAASRSEGAALEQSLARNRAQVERLQARAGELRQTLAGFSEPQAQLQSRRETALAQRLQVEAELVQTREALQQIELHLRDLEQRRLTVEGELGQRREEQEQARLDARGLETRLEGIAEQLAADGLAMQQVIETLPAEANETLWEERLAEVGRRINRLGPINLAAIDEFTTLSERKTYLDSQHADLSEALATLEEAMRKIDRETRTRFKETFDRVNTGLQSLFPILFGGGHAYLELIGEDLLETGVSVIARPPGKRNSTIHLLSGGEKALTAVALVFAIFELNPAPFCLLDEVDAPLDDANIVRLSEMLKQRARDIQFIFITHNKITMEIADLLVGVTMQEAGVSRLVSVNMEEAVRLAATA